MIVGGIYRCIHGSDNYKYSLILGPRNEDQWEMADYLVQGNTEYDHPDAPYSYEFITDIFAENV